MKSKQRLLKPACLIAITICIVALSGYGIFTLTKKYNMFPGDASVHQVSSLDEWQARSQLSGFRLLDRVDLPGHYICVYDTGIDEVAICYYQKQNISSAIRKFAVYDDQGRIVHDENRKKKTTELNKPGDEYAILGNVLPIKKGYTGMIQVTFKVQNGEGYKTVYDKNLPFNENDETDSKSDN